MKKILSYAFAAATFATSVAAAPLDPFTGFIGFGDSLSDKGRFPSEIFAPPSLDGRFSDGPTWMEIVGEEFELRGQGNFNLALGGATAGVNEQTDDLIAAEALQAFFDPRDPTDPDDIPFLNLQNFNAQIDAFFSAGFASEVGDNPLVAILLGGNDFRRSTDPIATAVEVISKIGDGIVKLATLSPGIDDFLVSNLPRLSLSPDVIDGDIGTILELDAATIAYNEALASGMAQLAGLTGLNIEVFDLFTAFDALHADGLTAGLIATEACTDALIAEIPGPNNCLVPGSSEAFLFADNIHPNSFLQSGVAGAALAQIGGRLAPIPLPSGLPLALAGIGVLVVVGRRKKAA